jgi:hypothetical protein
MKWGLSLNPFDLVVSHTRTAAISLSVWLLLLLYACASGSQEGT